MLVSDTNRYRGALVWPVPFHFLSSLATRRICSGELRTSDWNRYGATRALELWETRESARYVLPSSVQARSKMWARISGGKCGATIIMGGILFELNVRGGYASVELHGKFSVNRGHTDKRTDIQE